MCFNDRVSLITYIFGMYFSYQLYIKGFVIESIFYAWVIQMQLIEYFLWVNQSPCNVKDETHKKENNFISKIGIFVNHFEPIVLWIAILCISTRTLPKWINYIMILFCLLTLYYNKDVLYTNEYNKVYTEVTEESKPHLHWKWNYYDNAFIYYCFFALVLVLLSYYGLEKGYINAIIILIGLIISYVIYQDKKVVGSMWCFAAAVAPFILPILYKNF